MKTFRGPSLNFLKVMAAAILLAGVAYTQERQYHYVYNWKPGENCEEKNLLPTSVRVGVNVEEFEPPVTISSLSANTERYSALFAYFTAIKNNNFTQFEATIGGISRAGAKDIFVALRNEYRDALSGEISQFHLKAVYRIGMVEYVLGSVGQVDFRCALWADSGTKYCLDSIFIDDEALEVVATSVYHKWSVPGINMNYTEQPLTYMFNCNIYPNFGVQGVDNAVEIYAKIHKLDWGQVVIRNGNFVPDPDQAQYEGTDTYNLLRFYRNTFALLNSIPLDGTAHIDDPAVTAFLRRLHGPLAKQRRDDCLQNNNGVVEMDTLYPGLPDGADRNHEALCVLEAEPFYFVAMTTQPTRSNNTNIVDLKGLLWFDWIRLMKVDNTFRLLQSADMGSLDSVFAEGKLVRKKVLEFVKATE